MPEIVFDFSLNALGPKRLRIHSCTERSQIHDGSRYTQIEQALLRDVLDTVCELVMEIGEAESGLSVEKALINSSVIRPRILGPDLRHAVLRNQLLSIGKRRQERISRLSG